MATMLRICWPWNLTSSILDTFSWPLPSDAFLFSILNNQASDFKDLGSNSGLMNISWNGCPNVLFEFQLPTINHINACTKHHQTMQRPGIPAAIRPPVRLPKAPCHSEITGERQSRDTHRCCVFYLPRGPKWWPRWPILILINIGRQKPWPSHNNGVTMYFNIYPSHIGSALLTKVGACSSLLRSFLQQSSKARQWMLCCRRCRVHFFNLLFDQ